MTEFKELQMLHDNFARSPHGQWVVDIDDYKRLAALMQSEKPKHILELGTGVGASTAVMAQYSNAHIDTVEQFYKCINIAKDLIPAELQDRITFHQRDPEVFGLQGLPNVFFERFKSLPESDYDFVLIDGPGPFHDSQGHLVDLPGGDFVSLVFTLRPGTMIYVDGRRKMVELMDRFFRNYFEREKEENMKYTIFRRTDMPAENKRLKIGDALEAWLTSKGYFNDV